MTTAKLGSQRQSRTRFGPVAGSGWVGASSGRIRPHFPRPGAAVVAEPVDVAGEFARRIHRDEDVDFFPGLRAGVGANPSMAGLR